MFEVCSEELHAAGICGAAKCRFSKAFGMTMEQCKNSIGSRVIYGLNDEFKSTEYGVITSVNHNFVFVKYDGDRNSKATKPEDLVLEGGL